MVEPGLISKCGFIDETSITHSPLPSSDASPQLKNVITFPLEGSDVAQSEDVDHLDLDSPNEAPLFLRGNIVNIYIKSYQSSTPPKAKIPRAKLCKNIFPPIRRNCSSIQMSNPSFPPF